MYNTQEHNKFIYTFISFKGSLFKINLKTANNKKKLIAIIIYLCNKQSKGNTFMIIFQKFQQKIFFICTIYPVYGKEKLN
jgi:hypothetical protein